MNTLALNCPKCGASLKITPDVDAFACGYCGVQQVVKRDGGIVSLKLITSAISGVRESTDRIAAELAIPRLKGELESIDLAILSKKQQIIEAKKPGFVSTSIGCLLFLPVLFLSCMLTVGLFNIITWYYTIPFSFLLCSVILASIVGPIEARRNKSSLIALQSELTQFEEMKKMTRSDLERQYTTLNSRQ